MKRNYISPTRKNNISRTWNWNEPRLEEGQKKWKGKNSGAEKARRATIDYYGRLAVIVFLNPDSVCVFAKYVIIVETCFKINSNSLLFPALPYREGEGAEILDGIVERSTQSKTFPRHFRLLRCTKYKAIYVSHFPQRVIFLFRSFFLLLSPRPNLSPFLS